MTVARQRTLLGTLLFLQFACIVGAWRTQGITGVWFDVAALGFMVSFFSLRWRWRQ